MLAAALGSYALTLAAGIALIQWLPPLWAADHPRLQQMTVQAAKAFFLLVSVSFFCLFLSFFGNDFSLLYVSAHSNSLTPWYYRLSAVWGGHEGSLLLWLWLLGLWTFSVARCTRRLAGGLRTRVLAVLGYISFGFTLFLLLTSNPFLRLDFAPFDGEDLNPLLQDPGMIFHPPLLYTGYVGFAVVFAFVCAGLWQGRLDSLSFRRARPWTLAAWVALTLGITLGSYWAYYELGWGGWWFWDPVENAALMPWLIGTALLHCLIVAEKRGLFRLWTALLAILAFSLSLVGTFIVRSGALTSIHAFASDPTRGGFIIGLLVSITLPALLLLIARAGVIGAAENDYRVVSRETGLLLNNYFLTGACLVVLLGTLYPLIGDVLGLGRISVGAPYFNQMTLPLAMALLIAMGIGPSLRWRRDIGKRLLPRLLFALGCAALFTGLIAAWVLPSWKWRAGIALFCAGFALSGIALDCAARIRRHGLRGLGGHGGGMLLAHLGVVVMTLAITATGLYSQSRDMVFETGKRVTMAGYDITLTGLERKDGPNYSATVGRFLIRRQGAFETLAVLEPAKRRYHSSATVISESARLVRPGHDLYLVMGEALDATTWAVRVQYKPFILWIWLGGVLIACGGLLTACAQVSRQKRGQR